MRRSLLFVAVSAALVFPAAAQAATIVVTTAEPTSATDCTLTSAIDAANTGAPSGKCDPVGLGPDFRIEFALPSLPATIIPEVALPSEPKLRISANVEIVGPGASLLTISGGSESRVFEVQSGQASFADLTIAEGKTNESGAGLLVQNGASAQLTRVTVRKNEAFNDRAGLEGKYAEGGGIFNQGNLKLIESTVTGNTALNASVEANREANGGGIASEQGELVIERSTLSHNTAVVEASTGSSIARGGAVFVFTLTNLTLRDSTVSDNEAGVNAAAGDVANGGGISLFPVLQATIESSTIAGNTAEVGTDLFTEGAVTFGSTIVARGSCGRAGAGAITSSGYNLDEGSSCGFGQPTDQSGVNPQLAPALAANGGPTETLALLNGSPAIDHGLSSFPEATDQRGLRRPVEIPSVPNAAGGDGADTGAYEVQVPRAVIVRGPHEGETIDDARPIFEFVADGSASGFVCAIDNDAPVPCSSPFQAPQLGNGAHTFSVAALGEAGYAGEAASRVFTVEVKSTPSEPTSPPTAKPSKAPQTKINGLPSKTTKVRLAIRFSASQAGSTFQCKLDKAKWRNCRSPYKTPKLKLGKHVFKVKAKGPTGLVDQSPATKTFRVVAPARS